MFPNTGRRSWKKWTQYQLWTAMRPTVVGYCLWTMYTNWIYVSLAGWGKSRYWASISLTLFPNAWGTTLYLNLAYVTIRSSANICNTDRTEMSLKNIEASLTWTLTTEQEKYANLKTNQYFKKRWKHLFHTMWSTQHTIKNKHTTSLKNKKKILNVLKLNQNKTRKPLNKKCKKTWGWKTEMQ